MQINRKSTLNVVAISEKQPKDYILYCTHIVCMRVVSYIISVASNNALIPTTTAKGNTHIVCIRVVCYS